jgi:hypothetical protein
VSALACPSCLSADKLWTDGTVEAWRDVEVHREADGSVVNHYRGQHEADWPTFASDGNFGCSGLRLVWLTTRARPARHRWTAPGRTNPRPRIAPALSWAKLDDRFWMHPKVTAIGNEGAGVFARMLSFCGCYLTNGLVSPEAVKTICPNRKLLERMNDLDVIELRESGAVYIRDYLDYNHDRDKVEAERDAAKARMRSRRNGVRS